MRSHVILPILEEDGHPGPHHRTTHADVLEVAAHGQLSSERGRSLFKLRRSEPSGNHRHWEGLLELPMLGAPFNNCEHLAANFCAWSPNADRHLTASWSGLRVRKITVAHLLMYDWAFFTTLSFSFWYLVKSFENAECPPSRMSCWVVLLGDWSSISRPRGDGQTPGLRGSCLPHSLPPSRLLLFDLLLLLLLRFWLLLRQ